MAKKSVSLTFRDIVLGAEADIIREAYAARVKIDELIAERQAAYERIAALENQVEEELGDTGVFPFPAPTLPVAGFDPKSATVTRSAAAVKKAAAAIAPTPEVLPEPEAPADEVAPEATAESVSAGETPVEEEIDDNESDSEKEV